MHAIIKPFNYKQLNREYKPRTEMYIVGRPYLNLMKTSLCYFQCGPSINRRGIARPGVTFPK